jgi:dihydroorotate dehydrogenase
LVQIYTGFIYEGPGLINEINNKILESEVWSPKSEVFSRRLCE